MSYNGLNRPESQTMHMFHPVLRVAAPGRSLPTDCILIVIAAVFLCRLLSDSQRAEGNSVSLSSLTVDHESTRQVSK